MGKKSAIGGGGGGGGVGGKTSNSDKGKCVAVEVRNMKAKKQRAMKPSIVGLGKNGEGQSHRAQKEVNEEVDIDNESKPVVSKGENTEDVNVYVGVRGLPYTYGIKRYEPKLPCNKRRVLSSQVVNFEVETHLLSKIYFLLCIVWKTYYMVYLSVEGLYLHTVQSICTEITGIA